MYLGWTQVAFESDLTDDVVPVDCGRRALIAVRTGSTFVVYDGRCPHRGAHLGYGGQINGSSVVCPFHGHRIQLGTSARGPFYVHSYETLRAAGGLFVLFSPSVDTGRAERLRVAVGRLRTRSSGGGLERYLMIAGAIMVIVGLPIIVFGW